MSRRAKRKATAAIAAAAELARVEEALADGRPEELAPHAVDEIERRWLADEPLCAGELEALFATIRTVRAKAAALEDVYKRALAVVIAEGHDKARLRAEIGELGAAVEAAIAARQTRTVLRVGELPRVDGEGWPGLEGRIEPLLDTTTRSPE